jgi:PAS domain S-box-containing protein
MHPLPDQERIIGVSCFAKDVTERELAQQQLKEREKLLASIFNSTSDAMGLAEIDQAGNITYVSANQTAKNLFLNQEMGITMDRYEGSGVQQFSTEVLKRSLEQGEQTEAYFRQVAGTQNSVSYETQYQLPNKPLLYIETTLNPILDEAGGCRYVLWVTRDITQQKITEQTIRASRNQLNQIYHATKEMMSLLKVEEGGQYRIESVNLPFLQMIQVDAPDTQLEDLEGIALFTGHENWGDQSWHQMFRDILPHLKTVCDQKEKLSFEWSQFQKGEVKAYEVCLIPILDQKPTLSRILVVLYDQTERLKETEQTLIAINKAVEEDRTRMARELHDSLTQTLSIVSMNLKNLSYDLPGLAEQAKYWKAMEYLEAGIEESRSLAHRIMPKSIRDFGLIPSIEELVEQTEHSHPITIHFSYNQAPRLNNETEINLFRLVQQALKNVLSHAEATEVGIGLCFEDNLLHLWIRDNGKGFNYEQKTKSFSGIGLRTMRSRVQQLGGIFSVTSKLKEGTYISVQLPLQRNGLENGK